MPIYTIALADRTEKRANQGGEFSQNLSPGHTVKTAKIAQFAIIYGSEFPALEKRRTEEKKSYSILIRDIS